MATIEVDFNARDISGRVRLSTLCSRQSLGQTDAKPGDWVWLTDGELRVGGRIEEDREGLRAWVAWETLEDIIPPGDELRTPETVKNAVRDYSKQVSSSSPNHREILRVLPLVEEILPPGVADNNRAAAAWAFGYPSLALHSIEKALQANSGEPDWAYLRLLFLLSCNPEKAKIEAVSLIRNEKAHALILFGCLQILVADSLRVSQEQACPIAKTIIQISDRFEFAPGREDVPPAISSKLYAAKGDAFIEMGDRERAVEAYTSAIRANPRNPVPLAARGIENYLSDHEQEAAVLDLKKSLALGLPFPCWPAYYLSHYYVLTGNWPEAERFADLGLRSAPSPQMRANLLEWKAIAGYEQRGNFSDARELLLKAQELHPESLHVRNNINELERLFRTRSVDVSGWTFERDANGRFNDLLHPAA